MVAPIVGPTTVTRKSPTVPVAYFSRRTGYRQSMPIDRPLPYKLELVRRKSLTRTGTYVTNNSSGVDSGCSPYLPCGVSLSLPSQKAALQTSLTNKFREKLLNGVTTGPNLLNAFAERQQTLGMIADSALKIKGFIEDLKNRRIKRAFVRIGKQPPKTKKRGKTLADNYLMYKFGIIPILSDVGAGIEMLQSPYPVSDLFKASVSDEYLDTYSYTDKYQKKSTVTSGRMSIRGHARIRVSNPNLYLASQLGFTNPAVTLWEVTPFSFLVDWAFPIGAFLNSYSELHGLAVDRAHYTIWHSANSHTLNYYYAGSSKGSIHDYKKEGLFVDRLVGLPPYKLQSSLPILSAGKAAISWSLLIQQLLKVK